MLKIVKVLVSLHAHLPDVVEDMISLYLVDAFRFTPTEAVSRDLWLVVDHQLRNGRRFAEGEVARTMAMAAAQNKLEALQMLYHHYRFLSHKWFFGVSSGHPFNVAAANGHVDILEWMFKCQAHHCTQDAISFAASNGRLMAVQWLCQHQLTGSAQEAATEATSRGHYGIVEYLWSCGLVTCAHCVEDAALLAGDLRLIRWVESHQHTGEGLCSRRSHLLDSSACINATVNDLNGKSLVEQGVRVFRFIMSRHPTIQWSPDFLVMAARSGELSLVQWLYAQLPNEYCCSRFCREALHGACEVGHLKVVRFFVGCGYVPDSLDVVVSKGHVRILRYLQQACGAKLAYSVHAIDLAAANGQTAMLRFLEPRYRGYSTLNGDPIYEAGQRGDMEMVRLLCDNDMSPERCFSALRTSIAHRHINVVKYVYSLVRKMNWWGQGGLNFRQLMHVLVAAAKRSNFDALCLLLSCEKTSDDDDFWHVVCYAIASRRLDVIRLLHRKQATGFRKDAMDKAALYGSISIVRFLHENRSEGCSTNAMNYAAARGFLNIVEFLHVYRAEGCTTDAMDSASFHGHLAVVRFLHINRQEGCTCKATREAAANGHLNVVQLLLTCRTEGCSSEALHVACGRGHVEIVRWLVECHGEPMGPDLLDVARENLAECKNSIGMRQTVEYLEHLL